jgi:hypothetical protein
MPGMTVSTIIDKFGGQSALADALGVPVSTVHSWKRSNYIPHWRQPKIIELALDARIDLAPTDFPEKVAA